MPVTQESAETLALQALGWLASNDDLLPVFLGSSGVSEGDLRERAGDSAFLGGVLDFLLTDDAWVTGFCEAQGVPPTRLLEARAALPGGEQVHWT